MTRRPDFASDPVWIFSLAIALAWLPAERLLAGEEAKAVPTFHCIGLSFRTAKGSEKTECRVKVRKAGSTAWKSALPLWFDARNEIIPAERRREYRGSIVGLDPGTRYEIELSLSGTKRKKQLVATTWPEDFPIQRRVVVAPAGKKPLVIRNGGSPRGFVLYAPGPRSKAVIEVPNQDGVCGVHVKASYVIVRGLTIQGGRNGILIDPDVHDVVIEHCDISGWGLHDDQDDPEGKFAWGRDLDAAVYAGRWEGAPKTERLVIQRNRLHHPRWDSNSWAEYRKSVDVGRKDHYHPKGPQGITLVRCGGNHVIRYNEIFSDDTHCFNDGIGGGSNYSFDGVPNHDSDIYGNRISHCWDDGIEAEGANCNVRIWGNHIDRTMVKIATAATSVGPLYIFRNVSGISLWAPQAKHINARGPFLKMGGKTLKGTRFGDGRIYVFHNTLLQPKAQEGAAVDHGCSYGLVDHGGNMTNTVSRNNIFQVPSQKPHWTSINDKHRSPLNDFDYDLFSGKIIAVEGSEKHGRRGKPLFDPRNRFGKGKGEFRLSTKSPGYDAGVRLPNFNDGFTGRAPDMGAHEAGSPPMEFGVEAYAKKRRKK
ncbi:MAG: right-handed parallel beta-helix repeat-containing protein [Planctomycetota bacterium]